MKEHDLRPILKELGVDVIHKNYRGWLVAHCPFAEFLHERGTDHNPSFNVKIDDNGPSGFKCFSCGQHGRILSLVKKLAYYRGESYNSLALKAVLTDCPDSFPDYDREVVADRLPESINASLYLAMYPLAWEAEESRTYLTRRGITEATAKLLELRYDPERRRVMFPVFDYKSELFGFTGRSIIPDHMRPRDVVKVHNYCGLKKEYRLLGEQLIDQTKPILVVEGLFALAHFIEIGVCKLCNVVATMGNKLSEAQRDSLVDYGRAVYLCLDDDAAGTAGTYGELEADGERRGGAIDMLKQHVPTFLCYYPDHTGDPDRLSFEDVATMIDEAERM